MLLLGGCQVEPVDPPVDTSVDPVEICGNGLDDDGDGHVDCVDVDCDCVEDCTNGVDDDRDGRVDCADRDCEAVCVEAQPECVLIPICGPCSAFIDQFTLNIALEQAQAIVGLLLDHIVEGFQVFDGDGMGGEFKSLGI